MRLDSRADMGSARALAASTGAFAGFRNMHMNMHRALSLQTDLDDEVIERDLLVAALSDIQESGVNVLAATLPDLAAQIGSILGLKLAHENKKTIADLLGRECRGRRR